MCHYVVPSLDTAPYYVCQPVSAEDPRGFWLCWHTDWSGIAAFPTEVEALRYAVDKSMSVRFCEWGEIR